MLQSLRDSSQTIWNTAVMYAGKSPWLMLLSVASCLYLLIASPAFRKKLLLPIIILFVLVVNPVLYSLVYGNNNLPFVSSYGLRYWRFFWMLPQAILVGLAAMHVIRRLSSALPRCIALAVAAGIILMTGPTIYANERIFKPAQSAYKLTGTVETICEIILNDDPQPLCLFDKTMSAQVREYSGNIQQTWGRNGNWNLVQDSEAYAVYNALREKPRDWDTVFNFAEQRNVTHISFRLNKQDNRKEMLALAKAHGYDVLKKLGRRYVLHRRQSREQAKA